MEALDRLNGKLNLLIKKYTALETENKRLKATIVANEKNAAALTKKLASMEEGMVNTRMSDVVTDDEQKDHMRQQLDNVINEIDKILNTLND